MSRVLIDTGPLVALLNRRDRHHAWIREVLDAVEPPVFTCEAVLSEACSLLERVDDGTDALLSLLSKDILRIEFHLAAEGEAVHGLMRRFRNVPMSLADACLVRMTELEPHSTVVTLNRDFKTYRRNKRRTVPTILPNGR